MEELISSIATKVNTAEMERIAIEICRKLE